jgi:hypothetical protein
MYNLNAGNISTKETGELGNGGCAECLPPSHHVLRSQQKLDTYEDQQSDSLQPASLAPSASNDSQLGQRENGRPVSVDMNLAKETELQSAKKIGEALQLQLSEELRTSSEARGKQLTFGKLLSPTLEHSIDSGLSDLSNLVSSIEKIGSSRPDCGDRGDGVADPDPESEHSYWEPQTCGANTSEWIEGEADGNTQQRIRSADGANGGASEPHSLKQRIKPAALRINAIDLQNVASAAANKMSEQTETTPILSPQPISPIRQLRVKNSIPQLMKALPPLPGTPSRSSLEVTRNWAEELDFGVRFSSFNMTRLSTPDVSFDSVNAQDGTPCDAWAARHQQALGRLKLRLRRSKSVGSGLPSLARAGDRGYFMEDSSDDINHEDTDDQNSPLKGRLRQEIGKPFHREIHTSENGTIRRRAATDSPVTLASLGIVRPRDLFNNALTLNATYNQEEKRDAAPAEQTLVQSIASAASLPIQPLTSEAPSTDHDPVLVTTLGLSHIDTASTGRATLSRGKSVTTDGVPTTPQRLMKKLSNLRLMISGSHSSLREFHARPGARPIGSAGDGPPHNPVPKTPALGNTCFDSAITGGVEARGQPFRPRGMRRGGRMRRWVIGAKHAVRNYVKKGLYQTSRTTA